MNLTSIPSFEQVFDFIKYLFFIQIYGHKTEKMALVGSSNLTRRSKAPATGLNSGEMVLSREGTKRVSSGSHSHPTPVREVNLMSFLRAMLMAIAVVLLGMATANAQPNNKPVLKPIKHEQQTAKHESGKMAKHAKRQKSSKKRSLQARSNDPARCIALVMANEGEPNLPGMVSTGYTVLVRGQSGKYGPVGDYCAAAYADGQYTAFYKAPTAEMLQVSNQMLTDVANGAPTIEVAMQRRLNGSSYFHNESVNDTVGESWRKKYRLTMVVAGHWMYRDKGFKSPYRSLRGESPVTVVASN